MSCTVEKVGDTEVFTIYDEHDELELEVAVTDYGDERYEVSLYRGHDITTCYDYLTFGDPYGIPGNLSVPVYDDGTEIGVITGRDDESRARSLAAVLENYYS